MRTSASMQPTSILLVGASSRTGLECIQQLKEHVSQPQIHAFCEDPSELNDNVAKACTSVFDGSIRHAVDIEEALDETKANWIVLCGDSSDDTLSATSNHTRPKDLRTITARNVARAMQERRKTSAGPIRILVVSRIGKPGTLQNPVKLGLMARLCQLRDLRFLLDNAGQEQALLPVWNHTTVVRTTYLSDRKFGSPKRKVVELNDHETMPTLTTDRSDLARCIVNEICAQPIPNGSRVLNVTSAKD